MRIRILTNQYADGIYKRYRLLFLTIYVVVSKDKLTGLELELWNG